MIVTELAIIEQRGHIMELIVSLFPGVDILGKGFEDNGGFCVVRGPDKIWGGDIRGFTIPSGKFDGIIGGSPCQDFSKMKRIKSDYSLLMLREYLRCVYEAKPVWFLLENVPGVPDVSIDGYEVQRLDIWAHEFGLRQRRLRHFQFGSCDGTGLVIHRCVTAIDGSQLAPTILATDSGKSWERFLELQGLPPDYSLPAFKESEAKRAIGNAVAYPVALALADAIKNRTKNAVPVCGCGCGRPVTGRETYAGAACRKRMQRKRDSALDGSAWSVTYP